MSTLLLQKKQKNKRRNKMEATRTIKWNASNGDARRAEIIVEKKVIDKVFYADGYNIPAGKETYESIEMVVFNNDKKVDLFRNLPVVITAQSHGEKFAKEMIAKNAYSIIGNKVAINKEIHDQIVTAISEMEASTSEDEEFLEVKKLEQEKENRAIEEAEKEYKEYKRLIKSGLCPKCGTWCYGDCDANR
jgi:hypothetical protein